MSDEPAERNKMILEFRRTIAEHPNCAFHWVVILSDRQHAISRGHAGTSDLALALRAIFDDVRQIHVYGRCAHCDRVAMAMLSADQAFQAAYSGDPGERCQ